jgi:cytochrome c
MKVKNVLLFTGALLITAPSFADSANGQDLLKKSGCTSCHSVNKRVVGPALKDVANKYKDKEDSHDYLIGKIKKGSKGVWGKMSMPPNSPRVSDENIESIVDYILTLQE